MDFPKTDMPISMKIRRVCVGFLLLGGASTIRASTSFPDSVTTKREFVSGTFNGTRAINFHTIEMLKKGSLDFRISHRFGLLKTGKDFLWGIDGPANIRIGMDYTLTDRLVVGLGRTSNKKMADGLLKFRFLRQGLGEGSPVSVVGISSMNITTEKDPNANFNGFSKYEYFSSRIAYMNQLIVARKFSSRFSFQIMPTLIHYNLVEKLSDKNDIFSVPVSAHFKITKRIALTGEYALPTFPHIRDRSLYHNSASIGFDLETGGHVFQVFITNSPGINEVQVIPYTTSNWSKGEARLGFNISRVF